MSDLSKPIRRVLRSLSNRELEAIAGGRQTPRSVHVDLGGVGTARAIEAARQELRRRRMTADQPATDGGRLGLTREQTRNAAALALVLFILIVTGGRRREESDR